jgi:DNA-binding IclR family transcriptional regulator
MPPEAPRPRRPDPNRRAAGAPNGSLVPALDRGLAVLELLAARRASLPAVDLARSLRVPLSSLWRILQRLVDRGYLDRDDKTRTFALTRKLLALGSCSVCESHLIEESLDALRALRDATGETVLLSTRIEDRGVVLEQMPSTHPVGLNVAPGTPFDLHNTAPGKLVLALLPDAERDRVLRRLPMKRTTRATIVSRDTLRKELRLARRMGYALDRGEAYEGWYCIAAPIRDRYGRPVAELTLVWPSVRMPMSKAVALAPVVIAHADGISRRMGYEARGGLTADGSEAARRLFQHSPPTCPPEHFRFGRGEGGRR